MTLLPVPLSDGASVVDFDQFLQTDFRSSSPEIGHPVAQEINRTEDGDGIHEDANLPGGGTADEQDSCIEDLLEEASVHFEDKKPPFCVLDKGEKYRIVRLIGTQQEVRLVFRQWPKSVYGFWVHTNEVGDKDICKFDNGRYYAWRGVRNDFSPEPMAQPVVVKPKARTSLELVGADCESDTTPVHTLRKRTARQEKPYSMYHLQKLNEKKGIQASEAQLEASLEMKMPKRRKVTVKAEPERPSASRSGSLMPSGTSSSLTMLSSPLTDLVAPQAGALDYKTAQFHRTVLRSRLHNFQGPSMPVYLSTIQTSMQLFARLRQNWSFKLGGKDLSYCIIKFGWLGDDKQILLREGDEDGYRLMLDEFRQSPRWGSDGLMDADLDMYTD